MVIRDLDPISQRECLARDLEMLAKKPQSFVGMLYDVTVFLNRHLRHNLECRAVLFLTDRKAVGLRLTETQGHFSRDFLAEEAFVPFGRCLCGKAAQTGQVLICKNCMEDPRHETRWYGMDAHGHYVIPLLLNGAVLGVMTFYTHEGVEDDEQDRSLLACVGLQAGKGLYEFLQERYSNHASL
ncbi:MAG: GAF domain-containing protein [Candidatus Hydrogenedentes bacterium]|nr:GAF domain-containing protein [Candidatus Hydrogenedentota bacterium]